MTAPINPPLSREDVLRRLDYDPDTGAFTYKARTGRGQPLPGSIAGSFDAKGYVIINIFGRRLKAHRLAWLIVHGAWPEGIIDHINRCKADNRIANLRGATKSLNGQNVLDARSDNRLGHRGVHKLGGRSKRYIARMHKDGRRVVVGHFDTPEEAGAAYQAAKAAHLREIANAH